MELGNSDVRRWSSSGENSREGRTESAPSAGTSPQCSPSIEITIVERGDRSGNREQDPPAHGPRRSDGWRDHGSAINDSKPASSNLNSYRDWSKPE